MQEDLHLLLCGVGKGWEPKRQATPRAGACQAQKTIGKSARKALPSQIRSAINVPSGDRPSPHHALGPEPAARAVKEPGMQGMRLRSSYPALTPNKALAKKKRSTR
ncbi:hypothetical protein NDU88_002744 [Pleurodeles waltl]|uniref:Uncharacterized protein n=1 Tax=Pleurodeles waltl TaxID=8319 RepID=A0AAV7P7I0_PLEWA|nr:hypothetical protein NDU88_002744 [Pleurodeles waltl]